MSTSLKVQYANEIAEAMAKALGEKFEKTASFEKVAGPVLEQFKGALLAIKGDAGKVDALWNQYLSLLEQEENEFPGTVEDAVRAREEARGGPGTSIPPAAEDAGVQEAADACPVCGRKVEEVEESEEEMEPLAWDGEAVVAADFAMNHLIKVADILDGKGFKNVANLIDEALQKLAAKKSKKDEDEKKSKKDEKKSKKDEDEKKPKKDEKKSKKDEDEKKSKKDEKKSKKE